MMRPAAAFAVFCHVALSAGFTFVTPVFEDPDGLDQLGYALTIANRGKLPVIPGTAVELGRPLLEQSYFAHHPPLYYGVLAAALCAIDSSDLVAAPQFNPRSGSQAASTSLRWRHGPDETTSVSLEVWIYRGLRLLSIAFGAVSILLVHRLGRIAWPARPFAADLAAILLAAQPAWNAVHGCIDNGNLALMLFLFALVALAGAVDRGEFTRRDAVAFGFWIGLALNTKLTVLFALPLALGAFAIACLRDRRRLRAQTMPVLLAGAIVVAMVGWFFVRNRVLYGDLLAREAHARAFASIRIPDGEVWHWLREGLLPGLAPMLFTTWSVPAPPGFVAAGALLFAAAVAGALFLRRSPGPGPGPAIACLCLAAFLACTLQALHYSMQFALAQTRYLLPGLAALAVPAAIGLVALGDRFPRRIRPILAALLSLALPAATGWAIATHFRSYLDPGLAPVSAPDSYSCLLLGTTRDPPNPALRALDPPEGATLEDAPTLRWSGSPRADVCYSIYVFDADGALQLAVAEWLGARLTNLEFAIPEVVWRELPADRPLFWRVQVLPDRARGETPAEAGGSAARRIVRRERS